MSSAANSDGHRCYSFNLYWGLIGCAAMMAVIYWLGPYGDGLQFAPNPDGRVMWYYWQLQNPTGLSQLTAWGGYFLHQVSIWWLIYYAQTHRPRYSKQLHRINLLAIGTNIFYVSLHIIQTKIWYDGTAQNVPEWTSMASVMVLLVMVLIMENPRRGLLFGKPIHALVPVSHILRKYHGYYFSWAVIYTFWYHPIEITAGHLAGTFYTLMLLLQGSLMFTQFHRNKYWTVFLETFVLIHAIMVAWFTAKSNVDDDVSRFIFGLAMVFVVIQMYGLGLSRIARWIITLSFSASVIGYYYKQWENLYAIFIIPAGSYLLIMVIAALIGLLFILPQRWLSSITSKNRH